MIDARAMPKGGHQGCSATRKRARAWLALCIAFAGCSWHYVVVPERGSDGPGFQCAQQRRRCLDERGVHGTYVCQQPYYVCLKDVPGAVTFVVHGPRDSRQCKRPDVGRWRRCATQEY